ncbi:MAG: MerR family transcriptional regulator [Hyphomonadaceae bacterium]
MADDEKRYTAEQLAALAGVSLRTVRYYVQEELIDRPLARGPGAHFTDVHLRQLKRCKLLQDWGFDLETIRDKSESFQSILDGYAIDANFMSHGATLRALFGSPGNEPTGLTAKQTDAVKAAVQRLRGKTAKPLETKFANEIVPLADGIDLVIDRTRYDIPSPKDLVEIALLVRKSFDPLRRRDEDDDD